MDWVSSLTAPIIIQGGAVGLLVVFVIAILTGRLIPRSTYEDRLREVEDWKAAWRDCEKARQELNQSVQVALELGRITERMISSTAVPEKENSAGEGP